jgi:hypothetical protein
VLTGKAQFKYTLRISDIPTTWSNDQLREVLKSIYQRGEGESEVKLWSLAVAAADPQFKVATAELNPLPHKLRDIMTESDGISLTVRDNLAHDEHELGFDTEFEGLTTLHSPDSPTIE